MLHVLGLDLGFGLACVHPSASVALVDICVDWVSLVVKYMATLSLVIFLMGQNFETHYIFRSDIWVSLVLTKILSLVIFNWRHFAESVR